MTAAPQECSVKDDLIRDLEAERVVHSSALADLRSSTASLASTIEAVTATLAPCAPGKRKTSSPCFLSLTSDASPPEADHGDALALSHAVAQLVALLRSDNLRCDARAQRLQVRAPHPLLPRCQPLRVLSKN